MNGEHEDDLIGSSKPVVTIYSDGGYRQQIGYGGYGSIMVCGRSVMFNYGGFPDTTNNVMEIMGVLSCLRQLTCPCHVQVVSDSQYVCNAINKGWIYNWYNNGWKTSQGKPVQNQELWQEMLFFMNYHMIYCTWVKGHKLEPTKSNQCCDHLATIGTFKAANMQVPGHLIAPGRA